MSEMKIERRGGANRGAGAKQKYVCENIVITRQIPIDGVKEIDKYFKEVRQKYLKKKAKRISVKK